MLCGVRLGELSSGILKGSSSPGPRAPLSRSPSAAGPRLRRAGVGPSCAPPAPRRQGAASALPLYPRAGLAAGAARGGWGRAGPAGGAERRRPGPTCARPRGEERGAQPADPATRSYPPGLAGGRAPGWPPGDHPQAWNPAGLTRVSAREDSPHPRATHLAHTDPRRDPQAHCTYRLHAYIHTDHMRAQTHTRVLHVQTQTTHRHTYRKHVDAPCSQGHTRMQACA